VPPVPVVKTAARSPRRTRGPARLQRQQAKKPSLRQSGATLYHRIAIPSPFAMAAELACLCRGPE
jgi:hypothetical protein